MKIFSKMKVLAFLLVLVLFVVSASALVFASHSRVDLGTADDFVVLAGTAVTGTNTNVVNGDVGLSPTTGAAITLLTCAEMATGTIYDVDGAYTGGGGASTACRVQNAGLLTTAKNALTTAYNDAAGRSTTSQIPTELGGTTRTDGTYDSAAGTFGITGTLTLDGGGNPNAVFIFKMASTLITATSSRVVLTNSAQACNVYWQVGSSATLGTSTTLVGNVLALTSITDDGGSNVTGRLLARNAAVTLNNTTLTKAACAAGTAGAPLAFTDLSRVASTTVCPPLSSTIVSPIVIESRRVDADSIFISWGPYSGTNTFIIQYGYENGKWLFSNNVTGFSTTLNGLSPNQPIWVRIAARNSCSIGTYGQSMLVGGPGLPNTGIGQPEKNVPWSLLTGMILISSFFYLTQRKHRFS